MVMHDAYLLALKNTHAAVEEALRALKDAHTANALAKKTGSIFV
jgi:hypothetical protein